eukprot:3194871-Prymnesium_polylepis.1
MPPHFPISAPPRLRASPPYLVRNSNRFSRGHTMQFSSEVPRVAGLNVPGGQVVALTLPSGQ